MAKGRVVFPTVDAVQIALEDILPLRRTEQTTPDASLSGQMTSQQPEQVVLLIDRNSTSSAAIRPTALTVETTHYGEFAQFRSVVRRCMVAMAAQQAVLGVTRVGLRYVDEIRVSDPIEDAGSWERWVSSDLLAARSLGGSNEARGDVSEKPSTVAIIMPRARCELVPSYVRRSRWRPSAITSRCATTSGGDPQRALSEFEAGSGVVARAGLRRGGRRRLV